MQTNLNMPWFCSPFFERELTETPMDKNLKDKINFFADNGYLVFDPKIENIENKSEKIINNLQKDFQMDNRTTDAWIFDKNVKDIALNKNILDLLENIYQRKAIPFQTLNFKRGSEQKAHSDIIHFNSFPERFMAGVWVALEDITEDNGPVYYCPGSHKLPFYYLHDLGLTASYKNRNHNYHKYEEFLQKLIEEKGFEKKTIKMKKGEALIWDANLLHGGSPILKKDSTRYSQVTHYYFEDCIYFAPLYSDIYNQKIFYRKIKNISTNKYVKHFYNGKKINLPIKTHLKYFVEFKLKKTNLGRKFIKFLKAKISK